jgi:hypothetical protein
MFNSNIPPIYDLPSTPSLIGSTLTAIVVAGILLVTIILPAEYGIDPTGAGDYLGLTQMGEIKMMLAKEAEADELRQKTMSDALIKKSDEHIIAATELNDVKTKQAVYREDKHVITLEPGKAAELKLKMSKGNQAKFSWQSNGNGVKHDTHGHNGEDTITYDKGRKVTEKSGVIRAAFDGEHGWYWRNVSWDKVQITLETSGYYSGVVRL